MVHALHTARSAHRLNPAVCDFRAAAWLGLQSHPKSLHLSCVPCLGWTSNTLHLVTWHQRAHALLNTARCAGTHGPGQSDCFLLICRCSQETDVTYFFASDLIVCWFVSQNILHATSYDPRQRHKHRKFQQFLSHANSKVIWYPKNKPCIGS